MASPEEIIGAAAYPYTDEVIVEVTCRDEEGHLVVHSYPFAYADDGVRPLEAVEPAHEEVVREALAEKGYALGEANSTDAGAG